MSPAPTSAAPTAPPSPAPPTRWLVQPTGPRGDASTRSYFTYDLDPGASVDDTLAIVNLSDDPLPLTLLGTDAYTEPASGGFGLLPSADKPTDTGSWVQLATTSITVPARARVEVPFVIRVPINATPGDHAGGVVTSFVSPAVNTEGQSVLFDTRLAVRIYLRVTGDLTPALSVQNLTSSYDRSAAGLTGTLTVRYTVGNEGNVRLGAAETVRVTGPFGADVRTSSTTIAELLPGGRVQRQVVFTDVPAVLWLTIDAGLVPIDTGDALGGRDLGAVEESTRAAAVPWLWLVALVVVLLAAGWLLRRRRRAWKALRAEAAQARPEGSEALTPNEDAPATPPNG
jgi:hypothetical protein